MSDENINKLYPIFLKLENMHVLLVGGGNVALEKLESILHNSPKTKITIVAPFLREGVLNFIKEYPQVEVKEKEFDPSDLDVAKIVICATDNPILHQLIKQLANAKNILVNVADTPSLCDFYLGSIVQKGSLKIAISTNGMSPTFAKRLKELLNESLPEDAEALMQNLSAIRKQLKGDFAEKVSKLNEITKGLIDPKK